MSWMAVHYDCCVSTGSGGDATIANQQQILQALADLQTQNDDIELCVDEIKSSTVKPDLC